MVLEIVKKINYWDVAALILFLFALFLIPPVNALFSPSNGTYSYVYNYQPPAEDDSFGTMSASTMESNCAAAGLAPNYDYWALASVPYSTPNLLSNKYVAFGAYPDTSGWTESQRNSPGPIQKVHFCGTGTGYSWAVQMYVGDAPPSQSPDASFNADPDPGTEYPPVEVLFEDTSLYLPTSYNWSVNGQLISGQESANFTYTFTESGTYSIGHGVANADGSDYVQADYEVLTYETPVCSYSMDYTTGISPLTIQYTDSSTNDPISVYWDFNPDLVPWFNVYPTSSNSTFNPLVIYEGSGQIRVIHSSTNPAGTDWCEPFLLNISGDAPIPTVTPSVPFPNQTGVCTGSQITLGSGLSRSYDRYYEVVFPYGSTVQGYYPSGSVSYTNGYTSGVGQYFYSEYNVTGVLEWRMSYVTEDCDNPEYTSIPTPLPTVTFNNPYPTHISTINPTGTISPSDIPTVSTYTTIPTSLNVTTYQTNLTYIKERLIIWNSGTQLWMNFIDTIIANINNLIMQILVIVINPILAITHSVSWVLLLFSELYNSFEPYLSIFTYTITEILDATPNKVKNVITLGLTIDIIIQVFDLKRGNWR